MHDLIMHNIRKTPSEKQHLVNSGFELFKTRQQFCDFVSTLFQLSNQNEVFASLLFQYLQVNLYSNPNCCLVIKPRILYLHDDVFSGVFNFFFLYFK